MHSKPRCRIYIGLKYAQQACEVDTVALRKMLRKMIIGSVGLMAKDQTPLVNSISDCDERIDRTCLKRIKNANGRNHGLPEGINGSE